MIKNKLNPYDQKLTSNKNSNKKLDERKFDKRRNNKMTIFDEIEI